MHEVPIILGLNPSHLNHNKVTIPLYQNQPLRLSLVLMISASTLP